MSHHICHPILFHLISFHSILSYHIYISYMSSHHIKSNQIVFLFFSFSICQTSHSISSVCSEYSLHNYFIDARNSSRSIHSTYNRTYKRINENKNISLTGQHTPVSSHTLFQYQSTSHWLINIKFSKVLY